MLILAQAFILAVVLGTVTGANLWFSFVFWHCVKIETMGEI
jgi:hypothetical protein